MPRTRTPEPQATTIDRLRENIDSGLAGDKVPFPDPAAAPLGTDAEAGGHPPTPKELQMDVRAQAGSTRANPWPKNLIGMVAYCLAIVSIGLVLVAIVLVA